jgi:HK97 family phage major capsid protein
MSKLKFRDALLEADTGSTTGTVRLSFASEFPVLRRDKRGKYWEILSHAPGDANLGLLNRAGVVLCDHDDTREIGEVVRNTVKVDGDKKTRATINLSDDTWKTRAKTSPSDIPVSVGYEPLSILSESTGADGIPSRRYSWRPYEISLLTADPADPTVGPNRSKKHLCGDCEGTGDCADCDGEGKNDGERCAECDGKGRCADCNGNGYLKTARASKTVDSPNDLNVENLSDEQKSILRKKLMEKTTVEINEPEVRADENKKATAATQTAERARAKDITVASDTFIEKHGKKNKGAAVTELRKFTKEAIESGETAKDFNARCMAYILNAELETVRASDFVPAEEMAQFSLARAIQSAARERIAGREGRPKVDDLEGGIIKAYEDKLRQAEGGMGFNPSGFIVPPDAQFGSSGLSRKEMLSQYRSQVNRQGRDMQATVYGAGGAVVPTFWLLPVIDLLRNKMVLNRVGVKTLGGLTGNVIIPRLEAPSTAYSAGEIAALTASQLTLGQIAMAPHRVGNTVNYSKQLVFQSSPDIEGLIRDDMMKVLALKWDILGLNGNGSNDEPLGIMNTPGIGAVTFGATPTYIKMVLFETLIRIQNVMDSLAYVSTSATKGSLKTVAEALTGATTIGGSANALWKSVGQNGEEDGRMNGWPAIDSQQMPNNQVLCGAFENLIHGLFGGFDVVVDYYTKAVNAEIAVTMNTWGDYAVRHPQAFCVSTDAGNQ